MASSLALGTVTALSNRPTASLQAWACTRRKDQVVGFWDGTFTDYGTAVGTVGLALITTVSVIREAKDRRQLRAERDQERARADRLQQERADGLAAEERRRFAESVNCYVGPMERESPNVVTAGGGPPAIGRGPVICAVIQNLADKPITKVEVHWQNAENPDPLGKASLTFGGVLEVVPALGMVGVVKPDSLESWQPPQLALLVKFTDHNGVRWARRTDGRLHSVSSTGAIGAQER